MKYFLILGIKDADPQTLKYIFRKQEAELF